MNAPHIGLFSYKNIVDFQSLNRLASALQQQVFHLQHWWGSQVNAVVTAFPDMTTPHPGIWPIVIADGINSGNGGYHLTTTGTPTAYVQGPTNNGKGAWWTVMTSHEFLEMIIDPWGNTRLQGARPGPSGLSNPKVPLNTCSKYVTHAYRHLMHIQLDKFGSLILSRLTIISQGQVQLSLAMHNASQDQERYLPMVM